MEKNFLDALDAQAGSEPVRYLSSLATNENYPLAVNGKKNANDITILLDNLAGLFQDHGELALIVQDLCSVIAQQQTQILELENKIENVLQASIAVKAQENVNQMISQLALEGCDIDQTEVVVNVSAALSTEWEEETAKQESRFKKSHHKTETSLAGTFKRLLGLRFSVASESSAQQMFSNVMTRKSAEAINKRYEGNLTIRFNAITGSPLAKAKAQSILLQTEKAHT